MANDRLVSINPATGERLGEVPVAGAAEVEAAVRAARTAQPAWAALAGAERARILRRAATILRERNDELAALETRDTGKPIQETRVVDVISGAECIEYFAALAQSASGEHIDLGPQAFGYTRREPLGIVAGIGAWNYPLQIACWKSAPALAFGNAMIFKPASLTPLSAVELERAYREAGVPPGIFQVAQGHSETGRLLSRHPEIRKVSLTGSVGTGKAVMNDASSTVKAVTLELGGKSPLIVFEDAKLDQAVSGALLANFYSAGEVCSNGTRVFVQKSVRPEFLRRLAARVSAMRIGDPMDPATQVGSLISEEHMQMVLGYIARGRAEGARVLVGGNRRTEGATREGILRRADGIRRLPRRHEHRARGDLRAGHVGAGIHGRRRGRRAGKRDRVRAFRRRLHQRPEPGPSRHREAAGRDLLDQSLQRDPDRASLRRRQAVRARPRERPGRDGALHATQERVRCEGRHRFAVLRRHDRER